MVQMILKCNTIRLYGEDAAAELTGTAEGGDDISQEERINRQAGVVTVDRWSEKEIEDPETGEKRLINAIERIEEKEQDTGPSAKLELMITNPTLRGVFIPGARYRVRITQIEDEK